MKKTYITPESIIAHLQMETLLAGSPDDNIEIPASGTDEEVGEGTNWVKGISSFGEDW